MKNFSSKRYFRHFWSHDTFVHRSITKFINSILFLFPFKLKYHIALLFKKNDYPYCLINQGDTVIQIGAPSDTLHSARSRAFTFALLTGNTGKTVIIEPDLSNINEYKKSFLKFPNLHPILINKGSWSCPDTLYFYYDKSHPATNFTANTKDYDSDRLLNYECCEIPVDSLDNILLDLDIESVDLVSITTNGAESEILAGMVNTIKMGVKYICLAWTSDGYIELLASYGYKFLSYDDRGYTFVLDDSK
ncbi:hypothetical protein AB8880_10815 [Alphaproteobacteria bacterium LSUCC0684]